MTPSFAELQGRFRQDGRLRIVLKVRTKCGRRSLVRDGQGRLVADLRQAPEHGRANAELIELLSGAFGVSLDKIKIVSGRTGSRKTIDLKL